MRRAIAASIAAFAVIAALAFPAAAQIRGTPTSVTSTGFGGHFDRFPGIPASVTSLGPHGYNDRSHLFVGTVAPGGPARFGHRPRPGRYFPTPGYYGIYPGYVVDPGYYYGPDYANAPGNDPGEAPENPDYQAGPTIFDRRASGDSSRSAEAAYARRSAGDSRNDDSRNEDSRNYGSRPEPAEHSQADEVADQPQTILIYKDGRQLEVQNYAIVGNMLYDLTPGKRNKVALSDLNLAATAKENDDRGIDFQLPASTSVN